MGVDVAKGLTISHMASHPNNAQYPDASAVSYDEQNARVSVVYNDHSLYIWDVRDIRKVSGKRLTGIAIQFYKWIYALCNEPES